jgi:hypothetical protein
MGLRLSSRRRVSRWPGLLVAVALAPAGAARAQETPPAQAPSPAPSPPPRPIEELSLEELLAREIRAGEMGSFGSRLAEYKVRAEVHGYLSAEMKELRMPWFDDSRNQVMTFDLHHQVVNVRVEVGDRILGESQLEWEHAGRDFYVPLAHMDVKAFDWLIVRSGYFAVPVGVFNEYQYPDVLRKTAQQPLFTRDVVPTLWSEVGVQLRGKFRLGDAGHLNYAAFVSNGLEQASGEGGSIRAMRRHDRDTQHSNKAVGGRIGLAPRSGLDVGVSGYTGAYTADGRRQLTILDTDLTWSRGKFLLRLEGALALQEVTGDTLRKKGGYAFAAYRASRVLEPYLWLEAVDLDAGPAERKWGVLVGTLVYPLPGFAPNLMIKAEASSIRDAATRRWGGQGLVQIALGF